MTHKLALACLSASILLGTGCVSDDDDVNVDVVLGMIEAINTRDFEALASVVATDVVRHSAATPGVLVENLEQFEAFLRQDISGVPDAAITVERIFGDGQLVGVLARYTGTQTGQMGPFPPSEGRIDLPFISILRIEDEKIVEMWVEWDNLSMLTQLGHLEQPMPPAGAEQ